MQLNKRDKAILEIKKLFKRKESHKIKFIINVEGFEFCFALFFIYKISMSLLLLFIFVKIKKLCQKFCTLNKNS